MYLRFVFNVHVMFSAPTGPPHEIKTPRLLLKSPPAQHGGHLSAFAEQHERRHQIGSYTVMPNNNAPASDFSSPQFFEDSPSGGAKRKASEDAGGAPQQQRAKRNRYISIACNEANTLLSASIGRYND